MWCLLIVSLKVEQVSVSLAATTTSYWSQQFTANSALSYASTDKDYIGDSASGFIGYLRDFQIYIDASVNNFESSSNEIL